MHWSRSHFTGRAHCDVLLSNMCEVFNRQLLEARDKPIITCLEFIREYMMRRIVVVQKGIEKSDGPLTPHATIMFEDIKKKATKYTAVWNGGHKYQVSGPYMDQCVVDVLHKECTCRKWELTGMPSKHAVVVIWNMGLNGEKINGVLVGPPESWVHPSYWLSTWKGVYENKIDPINGRTMWIKSDCATTLTPPKHHKQVGRPKKKRMKSFGEMGEGIVENGTLSRGGKTVTCGKCKNVGHNSRACNGEGGSGLQQVVGGANNAGSEGPSS